MTIEVPVIKVTRNRNGFMGGCKFLSFCWDNILVDPDGLLFFSMTFVKKVKICQWAYNLRVTQLTASTPSHIIFDTFCVQRRYSSPTSQFGDLNWPTCTLRNWVEMKLQFRGCCSAVVQEFGICAPSFKLICQWCGIFTSVAQVHDDPLFFSIYVLGSESPLSRGLSTSHTHLALSMSIIPSLRCLLPGTSTKEANSPAPIAPTFAREVRRVRDPPR